MALVKWEPEMSFFPRVSSWMDDFFADNDFPKPMVKGVSIPAVNVVEKAKEFNVEVAAPGFKKDDFKLEVKNGCLTISGELKTEEEKKDEKYTRREFRFNSFMRTFTLPENVREEEIKAHYNDGILVITLPKKDVTKTELVKTISIQ